MRFLNIDRLNLRICLHSHLKIETNRKCPNNAYHNKHVLASNILVAYMYSSTPLSI